MEMADSSRWRSLPRRLNVLDVDPDLTCRNPDTARARDPTDGRMGGGGSSEGGSVSASDTPLTTQVPMMSKSERREQNLATFSSLLQDGDK